MAEIKIQEKQRSNLLPMLLGALLLLALLGYCFTRDRAPETAPASVEAGGVGATNSTDSAGGATTGAGAPTTGGATTGGATTGTTPSTTPSGTGTTP